MILSNPLFQLGEVVATSGAVQTMQEHNIAPQALLQLHVNGNWGCVDPEDAKANDFAVKHDERILSSYRIGEHVRIWIITEWDRSVTTLLLPSEY